MPSGAERTSPNGGDATTPTNDSSINPPAFLDLADSTARLNSNLPDINAQRIEQKRLEHERQRLLQRQHFEEQMRALELQQQQEERALLTPSSERPPNDHIALSAPTTPPRGSSAALANGSDGMLPPGGTSGLSFLHHQAMTNGIPDEYKRHSGNYGTLAAQSHDGNGVAAPNGLAPGSYHTAGAKSMPGSRRGSSGSSDAAADMVASLNLGSLSIHDKQHPSAARLNGVGHPLRSTTNPEVLKQHAASLFDEDLDNEMSKSLRQLPTQTEDERINVRANYTRKLSVSGSALDLAPLQQTRVFPRNDENVPKTSEWPQFSGLPRSTTNDLGGFKLDRTRSLTRHVTIGAIGSDIINPHSMSGTTTPLITQSPDVSRRPSPPSASSYSDAPSLNTHITSATTVSSARSVPPTPLSAHGLGAGSGLRTEIVSNKAVAGLPLSSMHGGAENGNGYAARSGYDGLTFGTIGADDAALGGDAYGAEYGRQTNGSYGYNNGSRIGGGVDLNGGFYNTSGGPRSGGGYSNGMPSFGNGRINGIDKVNGLGGPKHKRGDHDREWNRFAGTRLEDLQGDIPAMCKDQHGCRYLQKKLEEGISEQRDMIFRETYGHLSELMTDPFGNYLCQKLLEFSTDEQRNLICEAVAQDLVQISLNMHGTRAVQKMIDFLSNQRQTDTRYDAQVHTIIMALSMHVVTLIKDLNGNHVVQKCLNKLAAEDNQFIYNAVATHCVEVATHRHGCCVLQRCIDHASDSQRIQLVTEITYHALTLVQDPYGNYVVQYILDLNDSRFSDAVIRQFVGNVCALSVQKFSSNVIEKCIRVAEHSTRKIIIEEFLNRSRLEKLLRDSFGNYCVQTALDYAEPGQRMVLVEGIRPILPLIRNTPYGKRIQSKLQRDQFESSHAGGGAYGGGGGLSRPYYPQTSMRRSSQQIVDPYMQGSPMYGLPQSGSVPQQMVQTPLIPAQVRHVSAPQTMDPYSTQAYGQPPRNGVSAGLVNSQYGHVAPSPYGASMNGSAANYITSPMNDPYQRAAYPYV